MRAEVVPDGFVSVGALHVACGKTPAWGPFDGEPLTEFGCNARTMQRALDERARALGAALVAGAVCRAPEPGTVACSGTAAREEAPTSSSAGATASREPARLAPELAYGDIDYETASAVRVDLAPFVAAVGRRARGASEIGEPGPVPVSHRVLGSLRVRCDAGRCEPRALRAALRVAAGALCASDLAEVGCGSTEDEAFCFGTLAASERDPERDSAAR